MPRQKACAPEALGFHPVPSLNNENANPLRRNLNRIFIALVVISNSFGNILLAEALDRMPPFLATPFAHYALSILSNPYFIGGVALLAVWMLAQLTMFTWADLSYVLPVTASGYILTALLSRYMLNEHISVGRWAGIALITVGSMLASTTPVRTAHKVQR